ncbi:hypothetical protein F5B22DRAFT_590982 [Xylaria bambusicola]|uniref:uncharacterized protein n=1 Tax=Xylaria bambusicola TaxID=326684 RepID=UPI0020085E7F|nr:uncharacterized protein F5B22DRAFT_590982 [Xylaria bambusicola]KAI0525670.1 hypothetical protein F5B22DRAFT_590982 [Xylaria bambusicola]
MDARPYRPSRHLSSLGNEVHARSASKTVHQRHKSTGNLLTAPVTGNFNMAAKRTALGNRNVASRDSSDPVYAGKSGPTHNHSTTSTMVTSKAQENRVQTNFKPKDALHGAFSQPAQRPTKTLAPSASMGHIRPAASETYIPRRPLSKLSSFVYRDPLQEEDRPVPTKPANTVPEAVPEDPPAQTLKVRPSNAHLQNRQQSPGRKTYPEKPPTLQPKQQGPQDKQPSHQPNSTEAHVDERTSSATLAPLIPLTDVSPLYSPHADDDATEPLYVDAVEDYAEEKCELQTHKLTEITDAPQPQRVVIRTLPEPHVPEPVHPSQRSGTQPEPDLLDYNDHYPPSVVNDSVYPPYLSDCDDEEEHCYDDKGYTTAHSYRSHGDNTTGGVTTVMFPPKITKKGQAEIEAAKQIVESRRTTDEIQEDAWDISMVAEYGDEIFQYMKKQEMTLLPNPHYMDDQGEIQWSMRSVLMDWVVQVHARFGLLPETLFLTVNYIDRFLSNKIVSLAKLQLVGATAIFIAAKYEEINCPSVQEIVYMVDGGYTVEEILKAERFMLSMLDFELGWPGPMSFLRRISKADDYDLETRTLAKYFLEVVIMDERFVASPPSYIAAGAHCLSRLVLHKGDWTPAHVHYSGYTYQQLKPLVTMLLDCCRHARKHHSAIFEKYSDKRYKQASTYVEEEIMRGYTLPFEQRVSMPFTVEFFSNETTRASYAGSHADTRTGSHALKIPISTHG